MGIFRKKPEWDQVGEIARVRAKLVKKASVEGHPEKCVDCLYYGRVLDFWPDKKLLKAVEGAIDSL